jgi:metal-responsive CopG/Arc/MetJ family transcriptional regulator
MAAVRKVKISITLDADLVRLVDRHAANESSTRSAVMERWLRRASQRAALARLEEETASYYDAMTSDERDEDAGWAAGAARASRRLAIDGAPAAGPRPRRGR